MSNEPQKPPAFPIMVSTETLVRCCAEVAFDPPDVALPVVWVVFTFELVPKPRIFFLNEQHELPRSTR